MDEFSERRLRKHGFSTKVIEMIAANDPVNERRWVKIFMQFTPMQVRKANEESRLKEG